MGDTFPEMTAVFVPTAVARRPTFEQVLRPWTEGSRQFFLPRNEDRIADISFLFDDFLISTKNQNESDKERKLLYQGENDSLDYFAPAKLVCESTETAMKAFIAELKSKSQPGRRFFHRSEKKTFEDEFLEIISSEHVSDINDVVSEIGKCWEDFHSCEDNMKKAKSSMRKFGKRLNEYKSIFDLIPSESIYTSTLCAALKLLVNASVSYEAMAEGFARAMDEISFELANAKDYQALFNTTEMKMAVIPLYTHVMNFLCLSMRWCKKWGSTQRFFSSFSKGGYWSIVEPEVAKIKSQAQKVKELANKSHMVESRDANLEAKRRAEREDYRERLRMWCLMEMLRRDSERSVDKIDDHSHATNHQKVINFESTQKATEQGEIRMLQSSSVNSQDISQQEINSNNKEIESDLSNLQNSYSIDDLLKAALTSFSKTISIISPTEDLNKIRLWRSNLAKFKLPPQTFSRIQTWLLSPNADLLWIRGNIRQHHSINPISKLSANLLSAAQLAGLPTLYYFCGMNPSVAERQGKPPTQTILMILIMQALEWAKNFGDENQRQETDLGPERFESARKSEKKLWELFIDVINLLPKIPLILIDRLEVYSEDEDEVKHFIQRLLSMVPSDGFSNDEDDGEDEECEENDEDEEDDGVLRYSEAAKIILTSKRLSILMEDNIPARFKIDVSNARKGKGKAKLTLQKLQDDKDLSSDETIRDLFEESSDSKNDIEEDPET